MRRNQTGASLIAVLLASWTQTPKPFLVVNCLLRGLVSRAMPDRVFAALAVPAGQSRSALAQLCHSCAPQGVSRASERMPRCIGPPIAMSHRAMQLWSPGVGEKRQLQAIERLVCGGVAGSVAKSVIAPGASARACHRLARFGRHVASLGVPRMRAA